MSEVEPQRRPERAAQSTGGPRPGKSPERQRESPLMTGSIKRERLRERGQSTVELVLLVPLLLTLIFLIFEFGRVFGSWLIMTNAAREGARFGVTQTFGTSSNSAIMSRVQQTAQFLTVQAVSCQNNQPPSGSTSCINITWVTCPNANYTSLCGNTSDGFVAVMAVYQVQTLMPITAWIPFIGAINYPGSLTVTGLSTMRTE